MTNYNWKFEDKETLNSILFSSPDELIGKTITYTKKDGTVLIGTVQNAKVDDENYHIVKIVTNDGEYILLEVKADQEIY
jgi:hypothetical protein